MNKFKLRSLENEKRNLENKLEKIKREIKEEENTKLLFNGEIDFSRTIRTKQSLSEVKPVNSCVKCKVQITRTDNRIICKLSNCELPGIKHLMKNVVFTGVATCSNEDVFDERLGCFIAETRATQKLYKFLEEQMMN